MNGFKKQWNPKITNLRKVIVNGSEIWKEFNPEKHVIPAGHSYYSIIKNINNKQLKGA